MTTTDYDGYHIYPDSYSNIVTIEDLDKKIDEIILKIGLFRKKIEDQVNQDVLLFRSVKDSKYSYSDKKLRFKKKSKDDDASNIIDADANFDTIASAIPN